MSDHLGVWCTADGYVRQELREDGRYVEARGAREGAYTGRYEVTGDRIEYWDDSGLTADGVFVAGVLHHAGMVMRRRPPVVPPPHRVAPGARSAVAARAPSRRRASESEPPGAAW